MKKHIEVFLIAFLIPVFFLIPLQLSGQETSGKNLTLGDIQVRDISLINQNGETIQLSNLIRGKVVCMNFIYTSCKTICPPMGANFVQLNKMMSAYNDDDLVMLSVSIDPTTDTPERLKAWSEKFNPQQGWTLLTGDKNKIDQMLKDLKLYTPLKEELAPVILMGREGENNWIRTNALAEPAMLDHQLKTYLDKKTSIDTKQIDKKELLYFTNTVLINQHNEEMRFYQDLLMDKIVVINPFFSECPGTCPVMHNRMQQIQKHLGDRLGKDIILISITVDPENDRPEVLNEYAKQFGAKQGWYFLTGEIGNVNIVLRKLGKYVENREEHDNIFLIGNVPNKLWKKANGLAPSEEIIKIVDDVLNDRL